MITPERFEALWAARKAQNEVTPPPDEDREVRAHWATLGGHTAWSQAFHDLWRTLYPTSHAARFGGTFYATAESMKVEDLDEGEAP